MDEIERLRKNVRELAWAQGRLLKDIRNETGLSLRYSIPDRASIERLADVLHVRPDVLFKKNAVLAVYGDLAFRQNLWDLVISTGKTAPEVAKDMHIGKTTIYMWLTETHLPQPEMIRRISAYFGVEPSELLFEHHYGEVING